MNRFLLIICLVPFFSSAQVLNLDFNGNLHQQNVVTHGGASLGKDRFGKDCSALHLDGSGYLEIPSSRGDQITKSYTLSCWFKLEDSSSAKWLTLLCKGNISKETATSPAYRFQLYQSDNYSTISFNTEYTDEIDDFSKFPIVPNRWIHLVIKARNGEQVLFINGKKVWSQQSKLNFKNNKSSLFIGKDIPGDTEYFKGSIDDYKLYNSFLKDYECRALYSYVHRSDGLNSKYINRKDTVIYLGNSCGTLFDFKMNSDNNCGPMLNKNHSQTDFLNVGKHELEYVLTLNGDKHIVYHNVEVQDTISPTINCRSLIRLKESDFIGVYKIERPKAVDNCKLRSLELDRSSDSLISSAGVYDLKWVATDVYGNTSTKKVRVVVDKEESNKKQYQDTIKRMDIELTEVTPKIDSVGEDLTKSDQIQLKDELAFNYSKVYLHIYDNKKVDNDSISVQYNKDYVIENAKVKGPKSKHLTMEIYLAPGITNEFIIEALNTGKIGKNTVKIDFYSDKKMKQLIYSQVYTSTPSEFSLLKIKRK